MPWIEIIEVGLILLLLLVILGTMREVVVLRSSISAFSDLVTKPPEPKYIGQPGHVPPLLNRLRAEHHLPVDEVACFVFLSGDCSSCDALVSDVTLDDSLRDQAHRLLFIAGNADDAGQPDFARRLQTAGFPAVKDQSGQIFEVAGIHVTPSAIALSGDQAYTYEPGVQSPWLSQQLRSPVPIT